MKEGGKIEVSLADFAESEMARAALEDRQEAAPDGKVANFLRDNRSRELVWKIRTALGKLESQISRTPSLPEAYKTICNEAFDALAGLERLTANLCDRHLEIQTMSVGPCPLCQSSESGVPSEATPSKENAPLPDHLFGSCRNSRDPELCAGCERIQNAAASAPEVQGTPTRENAHLGDPCVYCNTPHDDVPPGPCKGHIKCAVCGYTERNKCHDRTVLRTLGLEEKYHTFAPVPVGTPQKETPPKQCTWVDRMDFTGGIQCNFQRGHKGRHSFEKSASAPDELQEKKKP